VLLPNAALNSLGATTLARYPHATTANGAEVNEDSEEHRFLDAAVQAEFETGERETTEQQARSHIAIRAARMVAGTLVLLLGIILIPLPGPGVLVVAGGLVILARDVAWADRALRYLRHKVPGVPTDGKIPRSTLLTAGALMVAGTLAALWFASQ